jgi:HlyD family secretion protein
MTRRIADHRRPDAETGAQTGAQTGAEARDDRMPSLRTSVIAGLLTIAVAFGGFTAWSVFGALDSAAIAPGVIIVDSRRKTIQHLEGGILDELLVEEGDRVSAGQPLLTLQATRAEAELGQLESQYWGARARLARLSAEMEGADSFRFPEAVLDAAQDTPIAAILSTESRLFRARLDTHETSIDLLRRRITQTESQIEALRALSRATRAQLAYMAEERDAIQQLVNRGHERRTRLLDLQRRVAELEGELSDIAARLAVAEETIAATELEIVRLQESRTADIFDKMRETQAQIAELEDRMRSARDVLSRTTIIAPQSGLITDIRHFTPGGVIAPGEPILDLVPLDDELVVEAQVRPTDIDSVHPSLPAAVRLTAYSRRTVPVVDGEVVYVAADLSHDETTGQSFYVARVQLAEESLAAVDRVELYPGMPTEVLITTGERSPLDYFLSPITASLARAGREE